MKTILSLAAVAALLIAFQNARAVEDPPEAHLQLVEVEQQTPYLESFAGVTAGTPPRRSSAASPTPAASCSRARPTRSSTTTTATAAAPRSRSRSRTPTPTG